MTVKMWNIMKEEVVILGSLDITSLLKAQRALQEALKIANSELERDGAIQRFEFTYELIWKTLKRILSFKGVNVNSPRDVFREAAKQGFVDDPKVWFEFIKKRNLTTHIYDQEIAEEIFECLPQFEKELAKVIERIIRL